MTNMSKLKLRSNARTKHLPYIRKVTLTQNMKLSIWWAWMMQSTFGRKTAPKNLIQNSLRVVESWGGWFIPLKLNLSTQLYTSHSGRMQNAFVVITKCNYFLKRKEVQPHGFVWSFHMCKSWGFLPSVSGLEGAFLHWASLMAGPAQDSFPARVVWQAVSHFGAGRISLRRDL